MFKTLKKWFRRFAIFCAIAYPVTLIGVGSLLTLLGQAWWIANAALYLPRFVYALPLPLLVLALFIIEQRRLLWTQLVAALVLLFPLMGFVLPWPVWSRSAQPILRILSYNVHSGVGGYEAMMREIDAESPGIVALQEILDDSGRIFSLLRSRYPFVEKSTQFMVASRYPIAATLEPTRLPHGGRERSPRFVRYLIDAPLGRIALYNVHPISPSDGFRELRGQGLRREILTGRILIAPKSERFEFDSKLRALQVQAFAEMAEKDTYPVVIAGDLNVPSLSPLLRRHLSSYTDGFRAAGWGFGYTFPSDLAWLRLDRIMASDSLKFVRFSVGDSSISDHRYVVADLQKR